MGMSFAEMHPELASEFSERNLPLTVSDITYGSNKKYWWIGKCGHVSITLFCDLASLLSDLAIQWPISILTQTG